MNYKGITLLQIEYFIEVANHLNFTEAAKNLYISQPSLSKQIAMLEQEIGVQLFIRTKRDVYLTPAGLVLQKELTGVIDVIENAIEKARQPDLGENGIINIGCLETLNVNVFLPMIIKKFRKKYPGIKLVFERDTFKSLREKLLNETLDVVFTLSFEYDKSLKLISSTLIKGNSYIAIASSNPLVNKVNLTVKDLKDQDFVIISRDESPNGFDAIINLCRKNGFTPKIVKQLPNVESILLCVELGLGAALFDTNVRSHNDNIKFIKIEDDYIDVIMVWKRENKNPAVSLFTNCALSEIK